MVQVPGLDVAAASSKYQALKEMDPKAARLALEIVRKLSSRRRVRK